jgi:AraC-like DNA-binding protein
MDLASRFVSDPIKPQLQVLSIARVEIDSAWNWQELRAPYWRLYVNLDDGAAVCPGSGPVFPLPAGHLILVPAWLSWAARCTGTVRHHVVHVSVLGLPRPSYQSVFTAPVDLGPGHGTALVEAIEHWLDLSQRCAGNFRVLSCAARAFAGLIGGLPAEAVQALQEGPDGGALSSTLAMIENRLHEDLSVQAIADYQRVSPATLGRLFRKHLGCSPAAYLRERRVAQAADELAHGNESIDQIADRVGYGDRQAFTKAFTAVMGCAPAAYRRSSGPTEE